MRLYLIAGGALLSLVTLVGVLFWRLDAVAEQRDMWRQDAESKAETIRVLEADKARTQAILSELRQTREEIARNSAETRRALSDLEQSNEAVRAFLDRPVPADLVGLLWPDENADDTADAPG